MTLVVAALYVLANGPYAGLPDVDVWDKNRDARLYAGPHPVVAHPPCERYGAYWSGGPSAPTRRELGDDDGCFAAALDAVNRWGGVLEHPASSRAWKMFNLNRPSPEGGWSPAGLFHPGYTCLVEQGHYGHRARKASLLYAAHVELPDLKWGPSARSVPLPPELRSPPKGMSAELRAHRRAELRAHRRAELRRISEETGKVWACPEMMSKRERALTPPQFRDLLISLARTARTSAEVRDA